MAKLDSTQLSLGPDGPLMLAGPVLRRTEPEAVTVWVVLQRPVRVRLTVYETEEGGSRLQNSVLFAEAPTWALGQNFHVVAVTARPVNQQRLECDRIYAYDLQFLSESNRTISLMDAAGFLSAGDISYFAHGLPTFALPPRRWQDLRLVHGSCRKPHAHGSDALPILDCLIAESATSPRGRPHQLFFTGDQVYSDDVSEPFLWLANRLGDELLGWQEELPGGCFACDLKPGQRAEIATQQGGFTSGMGNNTSKISSHMLSLGEFLAGYLLYFSPTCWPQTFPDCPPEQAPKTWSRQVNRLKRFAQALPYVRRALANIPVYTIFDDHDVSDDWNLNQAWCLRVLGRPLGRRVVQNALLAYSLMQGWGNTPDQFHEDRPGGKLLRAVERWSNSAGSDPDAWSAITRHLGLPTTDPITSLPNFRRDSGYCVLDRQSEALEWHYSVSSECHQVIALDSRTRRGFPVEKSALEPPQLLSMSALRRQLDARLQESSPQRLTFVIAPTNPFSLKLLDWIQRFHLRHNKVFSTDVGDAWNLPTDSLAQFLTTLFRHRQQAVILSGDIHFSFAVRLAMKSHDPAIHSGHLVQLTSSAIANEEPLTRLLHTVLKHWLIPEKSRHWLGTTQPAHMREVSDPTRPPADFQPDWQCTLDWLPRQKSQAVSFASRAPWLSSQSSWQQKLKFWRGRWFQEGREVVGLNNLAVVQFDGNVIQQENYWYAPWAPTKIVRSRFESEIRGPSGPNLPTAADSLASDHPIPSH